MRLSQASVEWHNFLNGFSNLPAMNRVLLAVPGLLFLLLLSLGCYRMRSSNGGGQVSGTLQRKIQPSDIALPKGYKIELVASGLTFPTAVALDDGGNLYAIEAGYSYGEIWGEPRLLRIDGIGNSRLIAKGGRNGPWTGMNWFDGAFYVAEGGEMEGGRILKISPEGNIVSLLADLPSIGDHHTNGPVIKDGYIYFGQGTATNSSVVGTDNAEFGWLLRKKDFHDIPCKDIILRGQNYSSDNPLTQDPNDKTTTGAYLSFGTPGSDGQVIKGMVPCNGAVMRIPLGGGQPEVVGWGFRNPFGLALSPDGRIFVTDNGFDDRGSRPVWGAGDILWELKQDTWYGWPDYSGGKPVSGDEEFKVPGKDEVKPVLKQDPGSPPRPVAVFGVHSSSDGIDFSRSNDFGYAGEAFVAEFGDMSPKTGKVEYPVGFKIVRVNVATGVIRDFAVNRGKRNGPASFLSGGGLERPVSVKFDPSGEALYIADFGIVKMTEQGPQPQTGTGVIWKITKQ
jgi:glucose/arabinose dehydrogenase